MKSKDLRDTIISEYKRLFKQWTDEYAETNFILFFIISKKEEEDITLNLLAKNESYVRGIPDLRISFEDSEFNDKVIFISDRYKLKFTITV